MIHLKKIILQTGQLDSDVFKRFTEGDKTAFGIVYHHYYKSVKNNISKIIFQREVAEDILQEVFFKLWQHRSECRNIQSISAWLFTVSYNASVSHIRKMLRARKHIVTGMPEFLGDHVDDDVAGSNSHFDESLLHEAIRLLPPQRKQVVELCKFEGKTYFEAGSLLGIERDTVKEYMSASLKFIKQYMLSREER